MNHYDFETYIGDGFLPGYKYLQVPPDVELRIETWNVGRGRHTRVPWKYVDLYAHTLLLVNKREKLITSKRKNFIYDWGGILSLALSRIGHVPPWNLSLDDFGKNGVHSE